MLLTKPKVVPLWITPNPEFTIETAGRTCYKSEDKITAESSRTFCRKLRKSGHHAMLEHASASFRFVTDRGVSHEVVRHRIASYAQESTRYCNYGAKKFGSACTFISPPGLGIEQAAIWAGAMKHCEDAYFGMLDAGCAPQIARSVLPNSLKTELVMTANFREWRHFIELRGALAAHPQIRPLAFAVWSFLVEVAPSVFDDLTPINEPF